MAGYTWADVWHLPHKVRNFAKRGYLKKVYNDGKLLKGRVITGDGIENDKLDIVHPVGYVAHVKPSEKTEIITMDIGGDSSRRVILAVLGDREFHPKPDEGEAFLYAPGNPKISIRTKMAGDQQGRANGGESTDSGRAAGIHMDASDQPISAKTEKSWSVEAKEAINMKTDKHTFEGDVLIKGNLNVEKDLRIGGEGYKPGDGPWAAGGVESSTALLIRSTPPVLTLPLVVRSEDGKVIIECNLIVQGNLRVNGIVTASEFVRA